MKWTRTRPGLYQAGPYAVLSAGTHRPIWTASGPDFTDVCGTKAEAQRACERSAHARLIDISDGYTVVPVVGDRVETAPDVRKVILPARPGQITSVIETGNGPLYCIKFARGKRLCLFRNEFKVVMP
ncbi:hypothetical protein FDI64_gp93 [Mycobacterium phage Zemanar]|uniref:Uncharacterized protein n=3 Tax=Caudoviricetes TaxID=2731619 RepID=A0A7G8LFY0_9CAUD|nr:hypothetical protein FDI64_gp93 [Mycobacterium phage Zemanar]YP_010109632.1 hypothetical protein KNV18_gp89 [Mycobacterium phage Heath]AEJ95767.1 hypothetical protein ZEMANAR_93 [Mycobacterium phage Zemanar]QNJ56152.1 hypothetical protein SEA_HEATH_89 [Mycobacterium phage Heath]